MARKAMAAAVLAGAVVLAGCSTGTGSNSDGGLTWSMWIGSTDDQKAWDAVAADASEAVGKDITIQGAPFADYWTKISTQLGTDNAPCIVSMQSLRVNQFTEGLLPLDDLIAESDIDLSDFDSGSLAALAVDGEQYALPYDTGPMVLFYNKDAFTAAGVGDPEPGWSVSDFEAAAKKLKDNGQVALATSAEDLPLESTVLAYNGSQIVADDGTLDVENDGFAAGVEWLSGLVADGYATRTDSSDASADNNAFINGTAASIVEGPWSFIDVASKADFEVGVATIPAGDGGGHTFSAGSGFGISSTCSDPEDAFKAIVEMTSEDVLKGLAEQGRAFPSRTAVQSSWYEKVGGDSVQTGLDAAQKSAIPLAGSAQSDQLSQLLTQYGSQLVNGDRPAADVLAEIASQLGS